MTANNNTLPTANAKMADALEARTVIPHLIKATHIISDLQGVGINPILYGSTGVSYYLGQFKPQFGDIDFLVPDSLVESDWENTLVLLDSLGFTLYDEHEHEFINEDGQRVQFGRESVLTRDHVLNSLDEVITVFIGNVPVRTLTIEGFKSAYEFSINDGYRRDTGQKDDARVIFLLNAYIDSNRRL